MLLALGQGQVALINDNGGDLYEFTQEPYDKVTVRDSSLYRDDYMFTALLHKSADGHGSPFPRQTYPTASVTGMPSAVKPLSTATRTWNSAT
jgi:hypothetical protein